MGRDFLLRILYVLCVRVCLVIVCVGCYFESLVFVCVCVCVFRRGGGADGVLVVELFVLVRGGGFFLSTLNGNSRLMFAFVFLFSHILSHSLSLFSSSSRFFFSFLFSSSQSGSAGRGRRHHQQGKARQGSQVK